MTMPEVLQQRFEMLQDRFIEPQYIADYFGIDNVSSNQELAADIDRYRATLLNPSVVPNGKVDRYALEGFLQARRLLPIKWAAARLGMNEEMLRTIVDRRLDLPTPLRREYIEYGCLIDEGLSDDLVRAIPDLRFRTFYDHESFCERLHEGIRQALAIPAEDIQAAKLWCATDQELSSMGLSDYPRRYGYYFDCLTCDPISIAHAMWLDFEKPLNLAPDRCSKLIFVRYRGDLEDWVAGTRAPDDLDRYEECLAGGN